MKKLIVFTIIMISSLSLYSQTIPDGPYFGQNPPGFTPEGFAPEIVSVSGAYKYSICFSPDLTECYFGTMNTGWSNFHLWSSKMTDSTWSEPDYVTFLNAGDGWHPFISYDNQTMFFSAQMDLWSIQRDNTTWSSAQKLGTIFNTSTNEFRATFAENGTINFVSKRGGDADIYRSQLNDEEYTEVESMDAINSSSLDGTPFIAKDENYLIFESQREGGLGSSDLWISFKDGDNSWTTPQNMGSQINTNDIEDGGYVSPEGKYLFFNRVAGNGSEIYWVDAGIIDSLKQEVIPNFSHIYFGQEPPGMVPEIFAPGIISVENRYEYTIAFSPDGKECCFGVTNSNWSACTLYYTKQDKDGKWSAPVPAYFQNGSDGWLPSFSNDNKKFLFTKGNPANIWMCTSTDSGWSNPIKLAAPVNTSSHEWFANTTDDGTLYFNSGRPGGNGDYDIYKSEPVDGNYLTVENLGSPINSPYADASPRISSDGKFMIFESWRPGGYGKADLYISYKKGNGTWSDPQNLGPNINTSQIDDGGYISPDGKYFFFNRREDWVTNKSTDIYWMDASFIEKMKPDDLNAYLGQPAPGDTPEVFAEGILSKTGRKERVLAFSSDGKEIYFSVVNSLNNYTIMFFEEIDGQWQEEKTAPFITEYMNNASCLEPFISPDGTKLLFSSKKDAAGGDWDYNIWITQRTADGWGEPEMLGGSINTTIGEWHPCITKSGNLYFARDNNSGDIYFSEYSDSGYKTAVPINSINSSSSDYDPYVDPDEEYIIFKSNRSGGFGKMDNYISFKDTVTGTWSAPKNLGNKINSNLTDDAGDISRDGKYMFFSRTSATGEMDVYWVSTGFIDSLKQTITSIDEKESSIPRNFNLYQNYPNPFNPSTRISYQLPIAGNVKLSIYNLLGQKIKTLVNSYQSTGEYSIDWDATDEDDHPVVSGIYFYKLEAANQNLYKKMVLLR